MMDIAPPSSTDDKLQLYLAADVEDMKDRLIWWYERRAMFPQLSRMARNYLSIPGESFFFLCLPWVLKPVSHSHNC